MKASRRKFIKSASTAAAAFTIVPRHVLGGTGFVAPSEKLVVAGIGVGSRAALDLNFFRETGKVEVPYLCDVDERGVADGFRRYPEAHKKAKLYKDFRELLANEHRHIDAVCVATPDHNHAIQALAAMQLGKHVYVEKPMAHDIWEARVLVDAAKRYRVVTQMGNQGASNDGPRLAREWYEAGAIGDVHTVYCWTDRPAWLTANVSEPVPVPKELDWDLWLGTAQYRDYVDWLVPSDHWRGWWDFGTGAIGDMGCHLMELPFSVLGIQHVEEVQATVARPMVVRKPVPTVRTGVRELRRAIYPESAPSSSCITMRFAKTPRTKVPVTLHWMDGGMTPPIPDELGPAGVLPSNGTLIVGTKGKILASVYATDVRLLPESRQVQVPRKYPRVSPPPSLVNFPAWSRNDGPGHYNQWVDACLAGYGKKEVSSPFEVAGPLTEAVLVGHLATRWSSIYHKEVGDGRSHKLQWDHTAMRFNASQFDNVDVNQFVKRKYRPGWEVKYTL